MAVVIVDGVQADRSISNAERDNVIDQLLQAMDWISETRESAKISWAYQIFDTTVNMTPWQGALWKKMPDKYYDGFDAIVNNSKNGRIYAFLGDSYIRFSNLSNGMDAGYPKPIAGHWKNLPSEFEEGIDAALWREENQRIYLFKGDQYVRIDPDNFTMDVTYPKPIAGHWKNLPSEFEEGIDAALGHKDNNSVYLFKGDKYVRFSNGSTTMDAGYPKSIAGNWKDIPGSFEDGISSIFWRDSNDKIYMIRNSRWGGKYVRMTPDNFTVEASYVGGKYLGLEKNDAEALWRNPALEQLGYEGSHEGGKQLAADVMAATGSDHGITVYLTKLPVVHPAYAGTYRWTYSLPDLSGEMAAIMAHETLHLYGAKDEYLSSSSCTDVYGKFFKATNGNSKACKPDNGDDCVMRNNLPTVCDYTKLHIGWGAFETQIDASVYRADTDKTYLFSGAYYIRYSDINAGRDEGYPRKIAGAWKGMPSRFNQGIDAAMWREDNEATYFFKNHEYVRFSKGSTTMDEGYPKPIAGAWKKVPLRFRGKVDAAFWRESNDKMYMFSGDQYIRLSVVDNSPTMDPGYPQPIESAWLGLPSSFKKKITAALMRRETDQMYLFNGTRYVRYSGLASEGIDPGYPNWIDKNWMPFPR